MSSVDNARTNAIWCHLYVGGTVFKSDKALSIMPQGWLVLRKVPTSRAKSNNCAINNILMRNMFNNDIAAS